MIRPEPTEDLSAITFLGEQIATTAPGRAGLERGVAGAYRLRVQTSSVRESTARHASSDSKPWYPIVEGYKDSEALGVHARFSDPLGFSNASVTASYSPDDSLPSKERTHAAVRFRQEFWEAGLNWNAGDFYDLFGPTKRSREGYSGFVALRPADHLRASGDAERQLAKLAYYGDLDTLPNFQNVPSPSRNLYTGEVGPEPQERSLVDRQRGRRDRLHLGDAGARLRRRRRAGARAGRPVRRRLCPAARPQLDLAAQRGRRFDRRPGRPARELLLRRLRQQLRRQR